MLRAIRQVWGLNPDRSAWTHYCFAGSRARRKLWRDRDVCWELENGYFFVSPSNIEACFIPEKPGSNQEVEISSVMGPLQETPTISLLPPSVTTSFPPSGLTGDEDWGSHTFMHKNNSYSAFLKVFHLKIPDRLMNKSFLVS